MSQVQTVPAAPALAPRLDGAPTALSPRSRKALVLLGNAVSLGALADALLRSNGLGLNVLLGVLALSTVLVLLARSRAPELRLRDHWLAVPVLAFAAAFAWRNADALKFVNLLLLGASLVIWAAAVRAGAEWDVRVARLRDYAAGFFTSGLGVAAGLAPVLGEIEYAETSRLLGGRRVAPFVRGAFIALPLLFIFGALFSSADPVFGRLLSGLVDWDVGQLVGHVVVAGIFSWLAAGYLRGALAGEPAAPGFGVLAGALPSRGPSLGIVEVSTVLGSLVVMFLAFVLVQLRYFFGGAEVVQATAGLTYAEYARRGFGELVFVAALSLPLLLGANAALVRERPRDERVFRGLAGALLALLHVVMLSAVRRMWLYQAEYGLTESRIYATAFMGWLFLVFAWFVVTVLRGDSRRFAFGALAAAWMVGGALNVLGPDGFTARKQLDRLHAGQRFDASYVGSLSADALPVLVRELNATPVGRRCQIATALLAHRRPIAEAEWSKDPIQAWKLAHDWRSWDLGRDAAARLVVPNADQLDRTLLEASQEPGCQKSESARQVSR